MKKKFIIVMIIIVLDILSKQLVVNNVQFYEPVRILPFLNIIKTYNYGITFGLFQGINTIILMIIVGSILLYLTKIWIKSKNILPLSLILGGAIGNLIDRFAYGYVIDFIDFHFLGWHYWAFNIADSAIVIGLVLLIYYEIFSDKNI